MTVRKRPSPALVVALLALFVSLSGTAVAAGVVPLAKRALSGLRILYTQDCTHFGAVDLPTTSQRPLARKKLEKAPAILQNVLRRVVMEAREAERIRRHVADAAETRRKAVYKTVFFEWGAD